MRLRGDPQVKPVIFLDLDGMVVDLHSKLIDCYNTEFGTNVNARDVWTVPHALDARGKAVDGIDTYLDRDNLFDDLEFLPGAEDALKELQKMGAVIIASAPSRNPDSATAKIRWVRRHTTIPRGDIALIKRKYMLNGDAWLEDWHSNITKIREHHPSVFIGAIEYPYNRHQADLVDVLAKDHLNTEAAWTQLLIGVDAWLGKRNACGRPFVGGGCLAHCRLPAGHTDPCRDGPWIKDPPDPGVRPPV